MIEAVGIDATINRAVLLAGPGGDVTFIGIPVPDVKLNNKTFRHFLRQEISLHGSWNSFGAPFPGPQWTTTLEKLGTGELKWEFLISHDLDLAELPAIFERFAAREFISRRCCSSHSLDCEGRSVMKFGIHSLAFSDQWTEKSAPEICRTAAEIGYDRVEVLMFDPAKLDREVTRRALAGTGLGLRLGMTLGPSTDISSDDADVAKRGEETVALALEIAVDLGAPEVSGIVYAAFNSYGAPHTARQVERVAEALSRLDPRAGSLGVRLGVEPVNRYESYMINTLDAARALIEQAGGVACSSI